MHVGASRTSASSGDEGQVERTRHCGRQSQRSIEDYEAFAERSSLEVDGAFGRCQPEIDPGIGILQAPYETRAQGPVVRRADDLPHGYAGNLQRTHEAIGTRERCEETEAHPRRRRRERRERDRTNR